MAREAQEQYGNVILFRRCRRGGAIINVPDEVTLNQMMVEWPLSPFSQITIEPIVDGDVAIQQYIGAMQAMQAAMQGGQR